MKAKSGHVEIARKAVLLAVALLLGMMMAPALAKKPQKESAKKEKAKGKEKTLAQRKAESQRRLQIAMRQNAAGNAKAAAEVKQAEGQQQEPVDTAAQSQSKVGDKPAVIVYMKQGALSVDAVMRLDSRARVVGKLKNSVFADGRISVEEFTAIRTELGHTTASLGEGLTLPSGGQVGAFVLKSWLRESLSSGTMETEDASQVLQDTLTMLATKRRLSTEFMTVSTHEKLQGDFNTLLNTYYELEQETKQEVQ